jgi:ACS family hexuronate transporter-like MFS transporter
MALKQGWQAPFVLTGLLGFLWIPLWLFIQRRIPHQYAAQEFRQNRTGSSLAILKERKLIVLVAANMLWMGSYSLWSTWTTLYLMGVHRLTLAQSAHYVWIPPLISNLGGFFGGWLSLRAMKRGSRPIAARQKAVWVSALGFLVTLLLPWAPDAAWATALISLSFFFALAGSVNIYALPIDIFGPARSGLAIAALTCAFGILQTAISPVIGYLSDHKLYTPVTWMVTAPVLLSALVLRALTAKTQEGAPLL